MRYIRMVADFDTMRPPAELGVLVLRTWIEIGACWGRARLTWHAGPAWTSSDLQRRIKKPQPQTDPFHYANHGHNLDKNIFMICHEIT